MAKRRAKTKRSVCPVSCALEIVGDRWTLLVVRDLFLGKSRFGEFADSPERIASNILATRLERLVKQGMVQARKSTAREGAQEYALTAKGRTLLPVLEAIRDWGLEQIPGTEARLRAAPSASA